MAENLSAADLPPHGTVTESSERRRVARRAPEATALIVVLLALGVFFTIASPYFLTYNNLVNVLTAAAVTGIIAAPATLLLIGGQFDLSVGSAAAFCGAVLATVSMSVPYEVAVPIALLAGLGVGLANGFLVTVIGINPLITTLGTLAVLRGLANVICDGQPVQVNGFESLGNARPLFDIPVPVWLFIATALILAFVSRYTVFGRSMFAIGANAVAARLAGIRSGRVILLGFVLSGLAAALGGMILTSQVGAASPSAATGLELVVITAVILGGASLAGGRGTIIGTMVGLLIVSVLDNGLILLNVSEFWQDVARGSLLILAVGFDQLRIRLTSD